MNTTQPNIYHNRTAHVTIVSFAPKLTRDDLEILFEALVGTAAKPIPRMVNVTKAGNIDGYQPIPEDVYETYTYIPHETAQANLDGRKILPIYVRRTERGFPAFEYQPLVPVEHEPPVHMD